MRTTSTLVEQVRLISNIPDNQQKFTNQQVLDLAYNELVGYILPSIMNVREEFYVFPYETPVRDDNSYLIPSRAVANKLRDVKLKKGAEEVYDVARIAPEDVLDDSNAGSGYPEGFYLEGAFVKLYPKLSPTGNQVESLLFPYFLRPNRLVELSAVGTITAINRATNTVSVSSLPSAIVVGSKIDLVRRNGQYDTMQFDVVVSSIATMEITLPNSLPESLEIGDYICPAETAPVVQIPEELYTWFTDRIVCRIMQAQGDREAFEIAQIKMVELDEKAKDLLTPRVEGESEILFNDNWNSFGWY